MSWTFIHALGSPDHAAAVMSIALQTVLLSLVIKHLFFTIRTVIFVIKDLIDMND